MSDRVRTYAVAFAALMFLPLGAVASQGETALLLLTAAPLLVWTALRGGIAALARLPVAWVLAALIVWAAVTAPWAVVPADALHLAPSLAVLFAMALVAWGAARPDASGAATVLRAAVAGYVLGCILLAVEILGDLPIANFARGTKPGDEHLELTVLNPGLTVLTLMAWPLAARLWPSSRIAALAAVLAAFALVALGESVTARVALVAGGAAFALAWWGGRRAVVAVMLAAMVAVLVAPLVAGSIAPERFGSALAEERSSILHRLYIWDFAAARIAEKPLLGWGLDASRSIPGGDVPVFKGGPALSLHPHDVALQAWLELGLPGGLALAAVIVLIGIGIAKLPARPRMPAAAVLATALSFGAASYGLWQNWWLASLGLAAVLARALTPADEP